MKKRLLFFALALAIVLPLSLSYFGFKKKSTICTHKYALCTSAQCIPDPEDASQTICFCTVHDGESIGYTSCDKRMPKTDEYGTTHLISTFSFEEFSTKNVMTCPNGSPWSYCLDMPCVVDPFDPDKAICKCKLYTKGEIRTLGGYCNADTCMKGYWSGATPESNVENVKALQEALHLKEPPGKSCPR